MTVCYLVIAVVSIKHNMNFFYGQSNNAGNKKY